MTIDDFIRSVPEPRRSKCHVVPITNGVVSLHSYELRRMADDEILIVADEHNNVIGWAHAKDVKAGSAKFQSGLVN